VNRVTDLVAGYQLLPPGCRYTPQAERRRQAHVRPHPPELVRISQRVCNGHATHEQPEATAPDESDLSVGTTYAWTATFASTTPAWADDAHADLVTTQNLEADIAILFEKVSVDLDARVKAKTDAIVQQAADRQIATLLERLEQNLTISREITKRVDSQLALRGN